MQPSPVMKSYEECLIWKGEKYRRNAAEEEKLGTALPFTAAAIPCDNRRNIKDT